MTNPGGVNTQDNRPSPALPSTPESTTGERGGVLAVHTSYGKPPDPAPRLCILGGLPGTGKTVLARAIARERRAFHLRIDTIEQVLRADGHSIHGPEGYLVAHAVAADNLRLGLEVVADSVNPLQLTRNAWRAVAERSGVGWLEIEVICSDRAEHRRRVESRVSDVPGLRLPTWEEVVSREYEPWDRPHMVVDTAGKTPEESFEELLRTLRLLAASVTGHS